MLSTFALVLILGIVVDDAVIIGESIHRQNEKGIWGAQASIEGAVMVSKPVIFSALTTMLAFSPLLFILGAASAFVIAIPIVVIVTLLFSLLESFCILPMHLLANDEPVSGREGMFFCAAWTRFGLKRMRACSF